LSLLTMTETCVSLSMFSDLQNAMAKAGGGPNKQDVTRNRSI